MKNLKANNISENKERLIDRLIEIWPNKDFVKGVLVNIENEDEVNEMLEFIKTKKYEDTSEILLYSLKIEYSRNGNSKDDFFSDIIKLADSIR